MRYKIKLVEGGAGMVLDEREACTDAQLFEWLGKFSVWYFLALDACDYEDAKWSSLGEEDGSDRLLAFTAGKQTDEPDGPHRHGMPKGQLARGFAWPSGYKVPCIIVVEEA